MWINKVNPLKIASNLHSLVSRLKDSRVIVGSYLLAVALVFIVNVREHILVGLL